MRLRELPIPCLGLALLLVGAGAARAEGPRWGGHGPPPMERVLERHAERLGLDDETRERIGAISDETHAAAEPLLEQLHELREQLHEALSAETPEESQVMSLADRIGAAETEARKLRLRSMLRIRALLSPAQREELVKIHEEMRERRGRLGPQRRWREDSPPLEDADRVD